MDHIALLEEAEICRRKAMNYLGKPEGVFLLRAAKAFEELDTEKRGLRSRRLVAPELAMRSRNSQMSASRKA